jgi:type II secretory pathway pseudopilin PulG
LVEIVVALAIFIFAGFALIGLLGVGMQNNRDSKEQLQAANIAEFICSTRRGTPMTDFSVNLTPSISLCIGPLKAAQPRARAISR